MQFGKLIHLGTMLLDLVLTLFCKVTNPGEPFICLDTDWLFQKSRDMEDGRFSAVALR